MPGDFDIYDAFDECGNPPIHLWARYLKVNVPSNWFCMFEEAKRRQRDWHMRQQQQLQQQQQQQKGLIRQSMIQEQNQEEYYYPPQQDGSVVLRNNDKPVAYSNTDVSSMSLNHHNLTDESIVAPSIVASTNIIDPIMFSESSRSTTTTSLHHQPSNLSTTSFATSNMHGPNRQVLSPTPSHREVIQLQHQPERSGSIMDREKIRRHLAPGQAVITNRNSASVVTLASTVTTLSPVNKESPTLNHHRSKELVHGIPEEQHDDENDAIKVESNISAYSNDMDFPHDSDRFSIRSDISHSVVTPSPKVSVSSKSRNRPSMKKIIWG